MTPSARPFRFGLLSSAGTAEQWQQDVARAQDDGYSTIVLTDHLDLSGAHVTRLAWLPAFADALARTTTLGASVMVANQDLRHPAVLARDVVTLDRLSGGRVELGLGAGWVAAEYAWAGLPFDPAPVARVADIVNLNTLRDNGSADDVLSEKVGWLRAAAPDRFDGLELATSIALVAPGTGSPEQSVAAAVERDGFARHVTARMSTEAAADAAFTLAGTTDAIVETLLARRERHGISYVVVPGRAADTMRPVVVALASR